MSTPKIVTAETFFKALLLFVSVILSQLAEARPEYAIQYGINRCTACHFSPAGGGARNINGKYFGARGYPNNSWIRQQDYIGADTKILFYQPQHPSEVSGGLGLMNATVWGSLALNELAPDGTEMRLVAEDSVAGFGPPGARQWYVRWQFSRETETSWFPQYLLVGQVIPAFGIMTDEHRTYVRQQTDNPWNTGIFVGATLAGNPVESIHYDLSILNGDKTQSNTNLGADKAEQWSTMGNLRWMSTHLPFALGASASWFSAGPSTNASNAVALYTLISLGRMTGYRVPVTISFEVDQAKNLNSTFTDSFVSDTNYSSTVAASTSRGAYALVEWEANPHWRFQYKYDQLALDQDFPSDAFQRHGLGFKHFFGNNMWVLLRAEKAYPHHPGESGGLKTGATDAAWALMNISI